MAPALCGRRAAFGLLFILSAKIPVVLAMVNYLPQSFFFDWNPPNQTFPVPVTAQCDTINIVWSRGTAAGPNPVPPYYLQVYTSLFLVPILIPAGIGLSYSWAVPFPPGTMYQICMYDSNGNTGGCQDTYTMIPSLNGPANCPNATIPPQLNVQGTVDNGPISRYGWIEQCTDIEVRALNGTPPYTFTIAPALHPPFNITGPGPTFNYTVDLTWGSPFFISLADSVGNMWSNGLLHSGQPTGSTACSTNTTGNSNHPIPTAAAIGSGVGGLFLGALVGLLAMFFITRKKIKRLESENLLDLAGDYASAQHGSQNNRATVFSNSSQYYPVPATTMGVMDNSLGSSNLSNSLQQNRMDGASPTGLQYHVEPFIMPTEEGRLLPPSPPPPPPKCGSSGDPSRPENKVYVVHHDSSAPPVTIYHENGTEIVELPPRYLEGSSPTGGQGSPSQGASGGQDTRSDVTGTTRSSETQEITAFLHQQRKPVAARKPPRDIVYTRPG